MADFLNQTFQDKHRKAILEIEGRMPFPGVQGVEPPHRLAAPMTVTRSAMPQRDLFEAEVRLFPLARTVEVARMVRFLAAVHGPNAERGYAKRCKELARRLRAVGGSPDEVCYQIQQFQTAVQVELQRTTVGGIKLA